MTRSERYQRAAHTLAPLMVLQTFVWVAFSMVGGWTWLGYLLVAVMAMVSLAASVLLGVLGAGEFIARTEARNG